jgi:hypothetical protein
MDKENEVYIQNGIASSHEKNEIVSFVATWIELKITVLSKTSQVQKDKYYIISLTGIS